MAERIIHQPNEEIKPDEIMRAPFYNPSQDYDRFMRMIKFASIGGVVGFVGGAYLGWLLNGIGGLPLGLAGGFIGAVGGVVLENITGGKPKGIGF